MIKDFTLLVLFLSVSASIWFLFPYKLLIVLIKSNPGIENNQKYFFRLLCKFMNIKLWFFVSIVMKIHNYKIMIFCETLVFTQGFSFCEKCNFLPNFVIDARNFRNFYFWANCAIFYRWANIRKTWCVWCGKLRKSCSASCANDAQSIFLFCACGKWTRT